MFSSFADSLIELVHICTKERQTHMAAISAREAHMMHSELVTVTATWHHVVSKHEASDSCRHGSSIRQSIAQPQTPRQLLLEVLLCHTCTFYVR